MKFNYLPETEHLDWPALNQETTVYVGDRMLMQGLSVKGKALLVRSAVDGACYDIPMGTYPMLGSDENRDYFAATGVIKALLCDSFVGITVPKGEAGKVCVQTVFGVNSCYDAHYEICEIETEYASGRQLSLVYSGSEGQIVKFTYVEGGMRSFVHDVTYDLDKSRTINYRGAQIDIHEADNERITYTVRRNFRDEDLRRSTP